MNLEDRALGYRKAFPKYPGVFYSNNWIVGTFNIGACYKGSGYHGSFPRGFLMRIRSMFPDFGADETLHLFAGSLCQGFDSSDWAADFPGVTFDINKSLGPNVVGDAERLSTYFSPNRFKIIISDCPYTEEDAKKYGVPLINRNKVVKECCNILAPGGFLIWMDMILPMFSKKELKRVGEIMITRSTNHRVRGVFIFERV